MVNVHEVAKYFLLKGTDDDENGICNMKLQKLVCPEVYHQYKNHGGNLISAPKDFEPTSLFSQSLLAFLDEVYEVFGQFSAWKLRNMTHDEPPWASNEVNAGEISVAEMANYFKTRVN